MTEKTESAESVDKFKVERQMLTEEEKDFVRMYFPKLGSAATIEKMEQKFQKTFKRGSVKSWASRHGVKVPQDIKSELIREGMRKLEERLGGELPPRARIPSDVELIAQRIKREAEAGPLQRRSGKGRNYNARTVVRGLLAPQPWARDIEILGDAEGVTK